MEFLPFVAHLATREVQLIFAFTLHIHSSQFTEGKIIQIYDGLLADSPNII